MKKITEEMNLCDVLDMDPELEKVFLANGLNCCGCPGANTETIREAAEGHGISAEKLLSDLNKAVE